MKVQLVNATVNSNVNNNNTFKAAFVNDANGYFRKLWQNSRRNNEFENSVQLFSQRNKGHNLEIIDVTKDSQSPMHSIYEIFNHRTGAVSRYWENNNLNDLMKQILADKELFNEDSKSARLYQKLTGQKTSFARMV